MNNRSDFSDKFSTIFVVDDNKINLEIIKASLPKTYEVFLIQSASKMFQLITKKQPDLILLDVDMPTMSGFEAIKILKSQPETQPIPVIFLSSRSDVKSLQLGLELGAADFLVKPVQPKLLLKNVELHLSVIFHQKVLERQQKTLDSNKKELNNYKNDFDILLNPQNSFLN
ncbi:MAG: response regulator [Deltaproteobacteria bacterium]|jgi:putative two-component system response regulator|nr:response regulator [Deltaproteobacteria bacterium]